VFSVTLPVFSLAHLLAPAFRRENVSQGPVTLVVVEIRSPSGWLSDEMRAEKSQSIRTTLQECLYPDRDVLLPKICFTGALELFFIVALTDKIGGNALAGRIVKQMNGREHVQYEDLTLSTSYRSLETIQRNPDEPGTLEMIAAKIKEMINEEVLSRMAKSG
jgi:hypothetical protein